ncbi:MAG: ABC transporter permease [Clostridiales bacterium]|jgi:spermidine/putrescine transport system permease protein|nr:ABC transporter permease [Clostridiales bacterium]
MIRRAFKNTPLYLWMAIFIVIPMLMIFYYAFFEQGPDGMHFTLKFFTETITNVHYLGTIWYSIVLALISTFICLLMGYPLASIISNMDEKKQKFMILLFILPMWINFLIRTYALMTIFEDNGIINSFLTLIHLPTVHFLQNDGAVVLGMVFNFLPFMILPIYTSLTKIDKRIIEAAQDLGGNSFTVFRKITFPLSIPGIISGITMVFMPAVTTFIIPQLLNGGGKWTIGSLIEDKFKGGYYDPNSGSALSIILMVLIFISMSVLSKVDKDHEAGGLM